MAKVCDKLSFLQAAAYVVQIKQVTIKHFIERNIFHKQYVYKLQLLGLAAFILQPLQWNKI